MRCCNLKTGGSSGFPGEVRSLRSPFAGRRSVSSLRSLSGGGFGSKLVGWSDAFQLHLRVTRRAETPTSNNRDQTCRIAGVREMSDVDGEGDAIVNKASTVLEVVLVWKKMKSIQKSE